MSITTSSDEITSSDTMWATVMDTVISRHPKSASLWRIASKSQATCQVCKDQGRGILLKCAIDKCSQRYHLDCAFNEESLSLDDEGNLTLKCDNHFKPVLFCSCKKPYDELLPYICCDSCSEWFHYSCVGLKNTDNDIENFTCNSCSSNKDQRQITILKSKNIAKEITSANCLSATKSIGALLDITVHVCPYIDILLSNRSSHQNLITNNNSRNISNQLTNNSHNGIRSASSSDIQEALIYLGKPIYSQAEKDYEKYDDDDDDEDDSIELLDRFGTSKLIDSWRSLLMEECTLHENWLNRAIKLHKQIINEFKPDLSFENGYQIAILFGEKVKQLLHELESIVCSLKEMEDFTSFAEGVIWVSDFLKV